MSSEFTGSFGFDSVRRLSSQRFDSARFDLFIADTTEDQSMMERGFEEDLPRHGGGYVAAEMASEGGVFAPILPPPTEEGFALREWRRQNAIRLEEKERKEKELMKVIIQEADEYKAEFYKKWKMRSENSKAVSREKQKLFVQGREKFHAEANKSCWKAVSELIPREIPVIEKKGNKEKEKQPAAILMIQGPKPGKPTDLSRMCQILVKLKHDPPVHMKPPHEPEKTEIIQEPTAIDLPSTSTNQGVSAIAM